MTCFTPIQAFESVILTKNRKFSTTLNIDNARRINGKPVVRMLKCRKCEGCRSDDSKQKAVKICLEAQYVNEITRDNCSFITLTYNNDYIPLYGSLDYFGEYDYGANADWTHFINRLRKSIHPIRIRYFLVGEYGDLNKRPHFHAIIFGYNFPDKIPHEESGGNIIYRSKLLESIWTVPRGKPDAGKSLGYSSVGSVTYESAAYVARYNMKKNIGMQYDGFENIINEESGEVIVRPKLSDRYVRYHQETGEPIAVAPERNLSSNGGGLSQDGGIGKRWFDKYYTDFFRKIDFDTYKDYYELPNGKIVRPPKYFENLLDKTNPHILESIKNQRQQHMLDHADDFTPEVLARRRDYFLSKTRNLKRNLGRIYDK